MGPSPLAAQPPADFSTRCATCHGADGLGGERGPNLATRRTRTEQEIRDIIRHGVPNTAMPAFDLPADVETRIVAFIRFIDTPAATKNEMSFAAPAPGDWPTYHGDPGGNRHSPLRQITTVN